MYALPSFRVLTLFGGKMFIIKSLQVQDRKNTALKVQKLMFYICKQQELNN